MIKLIACDVDGTLLEVWDKKITGEQLDVISELTRTHHEFALCSGRTYHELKHMFSKIENDIYFICYEGALCMKGGKVIFKSIMDNAAVADFVRKLYELTECNIAVSGKYMTYIVHGDSEFEEPLRRRYGNHVVRVASVKDITEEIFKISVQKDGGIDKNIDCDLLSSGAFRVFFEGGDGWSEFVSHSCYKSNGLAALQEALDITPRNTAAFGDNENNIEMLRLAKYSFATKDAPDSVKKVCAYTADDVTTELKKIIDEPREV